MTTRLKQMSTLLNRELLKKNPSYIEKLSKYIDLRNNRYILNISKDECEKMGISSLDYQQIVVDLEKTNRFISEVEKSSGQGLELSGKTRGVLVTTGQEQRVDTGWPPEGSTHVRFNCLSAGYTLFSCRTESHGGAVYYGTGNGLSDIVDVPIKSEGGSVKVFFSTLNSNGASAEWEFITKYGKAIKPEGPKKFSKI